MTQKSGWSVLPTEFDSDFTVAPMATANARVGTLLIRKIENAVESWPELECTKTIDIETDDMTMTVELRGDKFHDNCSVLTNWDFDSCDSGLEITSITKLGDDEVGILFKSQEVWPYLEISGPKAGDVNPVITVECNEGLIFHTSNSENVGNWTRDSKDSGLTFGAITRVTDTKVTMATTGTVVAGKDFTIQAKTAAFTAAASPSGVATYNIATESSTCTQAPILQATTISLSAKKEALTDGPFGTRECTVELEDGSSMDTGFEPDFFFDSKIETDDEDPSMTIILNNDEWASISACQDLKNWVFEDDESGLTLEDVEYVGPREATVYFSGTALVDGGFTLSIESDAFFYGVTMVGTYNIDDEKWANDGGWASQPMAGSVDVYLLNDIPFLVGNYAIPPGTDTACAIKLDIDRSGWDPRFWTTYVYVPNDSETNASVYFANLVMDT